MKAMTAWVFGAVAAVLAAIPVHEASAWAHWGAGGFSAGRVGEGWGHVGYGGVTAGRAGEGWAHAGYGGAAYGYHGNTFVGVHNTYVTGVHQAGGCYGCGAAAAAVGGLAVGAMAGAAMASASQPTTTVVVQQPPAVVVGTQVASLPGGCERMTVNGTTYYQCGSSWYKPGFGADGVYYQAVPVP